MVITAIFVYTLTDSLVKSRSPFARLGQFLSSILAV
jgi:hypothetical protein